VQVDTGYPWSGTVQIRVTAAPPGPAGLALRVPAWSPHPRLLLNGQPVVADSTSAGYLLVHRQWLPGDVLSYELDLTPRLTDPDRRVDAVRGTAAIERGPLVYCFEQANQPAGADLEDLALLPDDLAERAVTVPGVGPTILVDTSAVRLPAAAEDQAPEDRAAVDQVTATAIPYFQWDNQDGRAMRVWLPRA
jgi:uncharacterized protein